MDFEITFGVRTGWHARRAYRRLVARFSAESIEFDESRRRVRLRCVAHRSDEVFAAIQELRIPVYVVYAVEAHGAAGA
jgi:hypothetical protein